MKVSVIIPIRNEEKTIGRMCQELESIRGKAEIIFVDGESTDRTLEMIPKEYKVLHSPKGRAIQMNMGARESRGEVLFFLHCDSELPPNAIQNIKKVMTKYQVGCFGIAFHSKSPLMKCCQIISNHRIKDRKVMFGDQGIFIKRDLFFQMGGFPEIPIMEDYQFSLTLKEMHIKIGVAKGYIYTSDRRFQKGQRLKVMWKMNRLRAMYRKGVDVEKIAECYRDIR